MFKYNIFHIYSHKHTLNAKLNAPLFLSFLLYSFSSRLVSSLASGIVAAGGVWHPRYIYLIRYAERTRKNR